MTISKVMGVTSYSAVMDVADSDIANVMGVAQGGGGGATLLEGFEVDPQQWIQIETYEGTPLTGDITWTKNTSNVGAGFTNSTVTVTSSTSHVTQGTHTWRFQGTAGIANPVGISPASSIDLSAYNGVLLVDYFGATVPGTVTPVFAVGDGTTFDTSSAFSFPAGTTGEQTAFISMGSVSVNTSTLFPIFFMSGTSGTVDYYLDNMRVNKLTFSSTLDWVFTELTERVTRTTSHVTEGTYSWQITGNTAITGQTGIAMTSTIDLTAYTNVLIDMTAVTTATDDYYVLVVTDGTYQIVAQTAASFTGSTTLDADMSTEPLFDKTIAQIIIYCVDDGTGGPTDFYIDNLRAS